MKTPYQILDMPEDADFEALKAKYESLKEIYGEERFLPGDEGAAGAKKLTELEDAWSIILDRHREKEDARKYGVGFDAVDRLVKEKDYDGAQARLDAINRRDGEWHYYQALIYYKREWMHDSYTHLKEAVRLEPDNVKFRESLDKMTQVLANDKTPPRELGPQNEGMQTSAAGNCLSNCCTALCCMECLSMPFRCCG